MSLFKLLPWFNYQCLDNEENYDSFSLTCARLAVDNEQQRDNIIIASQSGMIAILRPSSPYEVDENQDQPLQYQASVVCETRLSEPILRVLCGNFFQ
jgi:PTHB1 N-terminus